MQSNIAIGAFLLLQSLDSWIYYSYLVSLRCLKRLCAKEAEKKAMDFQKKWIYRHLKILVMALVEFQKAQCYFILPVQAATLAALSGRTTILPPTTYRQYVNNISLFGLVGISGILPVMLILSALHGVGQKSWYVLGMSIIAVALSAATVFTVNQLHWVNLPPDNRYSACAYHDPSAFCFAASGSRFIELAELPSFSPIGGSLSMMTMSLVLLTILLLDFLWNPEKQTFVPLRDWLIRYIEQQELKHAVLPERTKGKLKTSTRLESFQLNLGRHWVKTLIRVIYSLTYLVIWAFLLLYLATFFSRWAAANTVIDTSTWSFGQIVAVTIWAAPLCEWVYLEFRKCFSPLLGSRLWTYLC